MNQSTTFAVIAIVSALAMFGTVVVMVAVTIPLQEAKAVACTPGSVAYNASQGRCFDSTIPCTPGSVAYNASQGRCFNP